MIGFSIVEPHCTFYFSYRKESLFVFSVKNVWSHALNFHKTNLQVNLEIFANFVSYEPKHLADFRSSPMSSLDDIYYTVKLTILAYVEDDFRTRLKRN